MAGGIWSTAIALDVAAATSNVSQKFGITHAVVAESTLLAGSIEHGCSAQGF
jgi:hypothetical protein